MIPILIDSKPVQNDTLIPPYQRIGGWYEWVLMITSFSLCWVRGVYSKLIKPNIFNFFLVWLIKTFHKYLNYNVDLKQYIHVYNTKLEP